MTIVAAVQVLVAEGESAALEWKRSTADLRRAGEMLCALLNGVGGEALVGHQQPELVRRRRRSRQTRDARRIGDLPSSAGAKRVAHGHLSLRAEPARRAGVPFHWRGRRLGPPDEPPSPRKVRGMNQNQKIMTCHLNELQLERPAFRLLVKGVYDEVLAGKSEGVGG
jgi:hypothetical protein